MLISKTKLLTWSVYVEVKWQPTMKPQHPIRNLGFLPERKRQIGERKEKQQKFHLLCEITVPLNLFFSFGIFWCFRKWKKKRLMENNFPNKGKTVRSK